MTDPRAHSLWEATAPPPPHTSILSGELSADVVVVGGGYTGLSASLHLAAARASVILLEANELGFGGAGRSVGLINAGMWVMPDDLRSILGPRYGERVLDLLGGAPTIVADLIERYGIDCELTKSGTLHCAVGAAGKSELQAREAQWKRRGAPVHLLSAREASVRIGSSVYSGALVDRRAGTLQPLAYTRGLAHASVRAGASLFTSSRVVRFEPSGERWAVVTASGRVVADWVIVATDAYSTGPWENVRAEQVHLPYFNFATAPLDREHLRRILPGREGCWDTKKILSSFRLDAAGRLVFGSVGALRGPGATIHRDWARRSLVKLFPFLPAMRFEYEWYGQIGMTSNAMPRFHRFAERVVGFSGYNGRGIAAGTVFGKLLADLACGAIEESALPLPVTEVERIPWRAPKEAFFEIGAQIAHLAGARL